MYLMNATRSILNDCSPSLGAALKVPKSSQVVTGYDKDPKT